MIKPYNLVLFIHNCNNLINEYHDCALSQYFPIVDKQQKHRYTHIYICIYIDIDMYTNMNLHKNIYTKTYMSTYII